MKYVELNPVGNFDTWQASKLEELNNDHISTSLGQDLLFENDEYRLWVICLYPGERLPFRMQNTNYSWTCLTGGLVVSRFADGSINFFKIEKEDTGYFKFKGKRFISDFENVGEDLIELNAIEYKHDMYKNIVRELVL